MNTQFPTLKHHEFADIFPLMSKAQLKRLAADIETNGLTDDIVTLNGAILDGRNRERACRLVDVEPRYVEWNGQSASPLAFVISKNQHRRQLTKSQSALAAAKALPLFEAQAKDRMTAGGKRGSSKQGVANLPPLPSGGQGKARTQVASVFGISPRIVQSAKALLARVKSGEVPKKALNEITRGEATINSVLVRHPEAAKKKAAEKKATKKKATKKKATKKKATKKKKPAPARDSSSTGEPSEPRAAAAKAVDVNDPEAVAERKADLKAMREPSRQLAEAIRSAIGVLTRYEEREVTRRTRELFTDATSILDQLHARAFKLSQHPFIGG